MTDCPPFSAVIAAGGSATRFGGNRPKQFRLLRREPVVIRAMIPFHNHHFCQQIVVAVHIEWLKWLKDKVDRFFNGAKDIKLVPGGETRADSVYNALKNLDNPDIVLINDAARPFITDKMIDETAYAAKKFGAATVAIPLRDTLKAEVDGFIAKTLDRTALWRIQTPQAFKYKDILEAHRKAQQEGFQSTDDCMLIERYTNNKIKIVEGRESNLKITTQEDLRLAEAIARWIK